MKPDALQIPAIYPPPYVPVKSPSVSSVSLRGRCTICGCRDGARRAECSNEAGCSPDPRNIAPSLRPRQAHQAFPQCLCGRRCTKCGRRDGARRAECLDVPRSPTVQLPRIFNSSIRKNFDTILSQCVLFLRLSQVVDPKLYESRNTTCYLPMPPTLTRPQQRL